MNHFFPHCSFKDILMTSAGVVLIGMGSGLFRASLYGADPFTTMALGVSRFAGVSFGFCQLIVNIILLIPILILNRKLIGIGTILNMVFVGYISDFVVSFFPVADQIGIAMRLVILTAAIFLASYGVAVYMVPEQGVAPYDAVNLILSGSQKLHLSYRAVRIGCDTCCILTGLLFFCTSGGEPLSLVGIGTICNLVLMGPLIQLFREKIECRTVLQS